MNFGNIQILSKGTTRNAPTVEVNYDVKFSSYVKNTKNGEETVKHFLFTRQIMKKTGLDLADKAAAPFFDATNGIAGIVVLPAEKGEFLAPAKRSKDGLKSNRVSVPNLVTALASAGELDLEFAGHQHYDLVELGQEGEMTFYRLAKSSKVENKAYVAGEVEETTQDETASSAE